jgi:phage shock protein PspC (stress-responsive transcriptional regulator)
MIAGVCGGLADRLDIDPSVVRVAWVLVGILTGVVPLLVLYVLMAVVVPEEPSGFLESMAISPPGGTTAAAAWRSAQDAEWAARRAARRAARGQRRTDPLVPALVGVGLVAIGGFLLLREWFPIDWDMVWPLGLVAIGVVLLIAAIRR